jgi:hypothetical protein
MSREAARSGAGLPVSNDVELRRLSHATRCRLREALKPIQMIDRLVRDALTDS